MFSNFFLHDTGSAYLLLFFLVALIPIFLGLSLVGISFKKRGRENPSQSVSDYTLFQITKINEPSAKAQTHIEQIRQFEKFLVSIAQEEKPIIFEAHASSDKEEPSFFIALPTELRDAVYTHATRIFKHIRIQDDLDRTTTDQQKNTILADVQPNKPDVPLDEVDHDAFSSIIKVLSGTTKEGDDVVVQLVLQKASSKIRQTVSRTTKIAKRLRGSLYLANIRVGISAHTKQRANSLLLQIQKSFNPDTKHQNNFTLLRRTDRRMGVNFGFRFADHENAVTLSGEEVGNIFRVYDGNESEVIKKQVEASLTEESGEALLGDNMFHGKAKPVYLSEHDRLHHFHLVGEANTGKTALMSSLAYQDIMHGKGVCVIDSCGTLINTLLANIPEHRIDDVVLFDPTDTHHVPAINPLEVDANEPEQRTFVIHELLAFFDDVFTDTDTQTSLSLHNYIRNALALLMSSGTSAPMTLLDLPRVITSEQFRSSLLERCTIDPVRRFWQEEAVGTSTATALHTIAPYITSKCSAFATNDHVRAVIEKPHSSLSLSRVIDKNLILFVKLPRSILDKASVKLLSTIIITKIMLALQKHEPQQKNRYLYIDELQDVATNTIGTKLTLAQEKNLGVIMAHRSMSQLTSVVQGSLLESAQNTAIFRTEEKDAALLKKKTAPRFSTTDLTTTENLTYILTTPTTQAFNTHVRFTPKGSDKIRMLVSRYAALRTQI